MFILELPSRDVYVTSVKTASTVAYDFSVAIEFECDDQTYRSPKFFCGTNGFTNRYATDLSIVVWKLIKANRHENIQASIQEFMREFYETKLLKDGKYYADIESAVNEGVDKLVFSSVIQEWCNAARVCIESMQHIHQGGKS